MEKVTFSNSKDFQFAGQFMNQAASILTFEIDQEELTYQISHPIIARLLKNIDSHSPTVLPYKHTRYDEWIVIAPTRQQLDRLLTKMNRFIGATFGAYTDNEHFPTLNIFDQQYGPSYSNEYYAWRSPKHFRENILNILEMWLDLEEASPDLRLLTPPNFRDVFKSFQSALAAHIWNDAEQALLILRQNRLTTLKNISYLTIELLAQKQQYEKIWMNNSFRALAKGTLPRRVHVALIKAFHHQKLLANEQNGDVEQNLAIVQTAQTQFDKLLTYRTDIIDDIAVRVYAYLSAVNQTPESFEKLATIDTLSEITHQFIEKLKPFVQPIPEKSPKERFKELFQNQDFSNAYSVANKIRDELIRIPAQMQCIARLNDSNLAKLVLDQYDGLDETQKDIIANQDPLFPIYLDVINTITTAQPQIYTNWIDWFEAALNNPDSDRLSESFDYLEENTDKEYWSLKNVAKLRDYLGVVTFDKSKAPPDDLKIISSHYFEKAMDFLLSQLVKDDQFPRIQNLFGEIYSSFYSYMLHSSKNTQTNAEILLRLADDKITRDPMRNLSTYNELINWIDPPRSSAQDFWLDIVELGIYHGLGKEHLYISYQAWIQVILDTPINPERSIIEVLLSLSQWFGDYAKRWIKHLEEKLVQSTSDVVDPITLLPVGYRIIIYTLDESSAKRVQDILYKRNNKIEVVLCHEKTMTQQIEQLTINSDMQVLVTTCMKHSVYYGISDYINSPVYPQSRGSSSILRAIENRSLDYTPSL